MKYKEKMPEILKYISEGYNQKEAFEKSGVGHTQFYKWMLENADFADAVHKAQDEARNNRRGIEDVEQALLDVAKGLELEDVRTEYESRLDEETKKYVPVIKKQVRTTKKFPCNVDAAKFYLTNREPDKWKNRVEQNTTAQLNNEIKIRYIDSNGNDVKFPSSEDEVDLTREKKE